MTALGRERCAYDAAGRPTVYRDGQCTWTRGSLTRYEKAGRVTTFAYDSRGLRIRKNDTEYLYLGERLIRQATAADTLDFFYDESGLAGIRHNGVDYLVRKNVFGDITHLYAPDGGVAARYDYDAWGNPRITVSGGHRVGELNPFLYRGYCYDRETGYYYLRTRYYDPEACRFLSPDDPSLLLLTGDHANGIMNYTYCADNPVMDVDDDGQMPKWLRVLLGIVTIGIAIAVTVASGGSLAPVFIGMGVGAVTSAGFELAAQGIAGNGMDWEQVGWAAFGGAVAGAFAGVNVGGRVIKVMGRFAKLGSYGISFVVGGIGASTGGLITGSVSSFSTYATAFGIGAFTNVVGKFIGDKISKLVTLKAGQSMNHVWAENLSLEDLIGIDLPNNGNMSSYNTFLKWASKQVVNSLGHFYSSLQYSLINSGISSLFGGWY